MFDYKKYFLYDDDEPAGALPTPVTTKEQYLYAKVTGGDTSNLPTSVTTEEQYLYAMAQSGGGGGGSVSAVTLYPDFNASPSILYKDEALTQGFATAEEAIAFIENNPLIRIKLSDKYVLPVAYDWLGGFSVFASVYQDSYCLFLGEPDPGHDPFIS